MRRVVIILCFVLIVLISSGCLGSETTTAPPETTIAPTTVKPTEIPKAEDEYYVNIYAEKRDDGVLVFGDTNIPEGSELFIGVSRLYTEIGVVDDEYLIGNTQKKDVVVSSGKFRHLLVPEDMDAYSKDKEVVLEVINKELERLEKYGITSSGVDVISDVGTVDATFTPKGRQPELVYQILGKRFEYLNGKDVSSAGSHPFNVLSVESEFELQNHT